MIQFCQKDQCRTQQVLTYFGQSADPCGTCDVCQKNSLPLNSIPEKQLTPLVWTTNQNFIPLKDAIQNPTICAASNWLGLASFVAKKQHSKTPFSSGVSFG